MPSDKPYPKIMRWKDHHEFKILIESGNRYFGIGTVISSFGSLPSQLGFWSSTWNLDVFEDDPEFTSSEDLRYTYMEGEERVHIQNDNRPINASYDLYFREGKPIAHDTKG